MTSPFTGRTNRAGSTYQNLMVDLRPSNAKLRGQSIELLV
jgi:N-acetylmuramic acid 6-phosphate (MurNAc-6-P) etherase